VELAAEGPGHGACGARREWTRHNTEQEWTWLKNERATEQGQFRALQVEVEREVRRIEVLWEEREQQDKRRRAQEERRALQKVEQKQVAACLRQRTWRGLGPRCSCARRSSTPRTVSGCGSASRHCGRKPGGSGCSFMRSRRARHSRLR
jgi:hypothetical protein